MTQHVTRPAPRSLSKPTASASPTADSGKAPDFDPELFLDGIDPQYQAELERSIALCAGFQPALRRHHGFTGTGRDGWPGFATRGDLVQQRRRLQQLRRGPTTFEHMGANAIASSEHLV